MFTDTWRILNRDRPDLSAARRESNYSIYSINVCNYTPWCQLPEKRHCLPNSTYDKFNLVQLPNGKSYNRRSNYRLGGYTMNGQVKKLMTGVSMVGAAVGVYSSVGPAIAPAVQAGAPAACDSYCKANCKNLGCNKWICDTNHCGCDCHSQ
jgi:hypothetical protein